MATEFQPETSSAKLAPILAPVHIGQTIMKNTRKYTRKDAREIYDRIQSIIEHGRLAYFDGTGIEPVPMPLTKKDIDQMIGQASIFWLKLRMDGASDEEADTTIFNVASVLGWMDKEDANKTRH